MGLNLLKDLQKLNSLEKTKVLFVSGSLEVRIEALETGASRFIQKPCNFNYLRKTIREVVKERKKAMLFATT